MWCETFINTKINSELIDKIIKIVRHFKLTNTTKQEMTKSILEEKKQ